MQLINLRLFVQFLKDKYGFSSPDVYSPPNPDTHFYFSCPDRDWGPTLCTSIQDYAKKQAFKILNRDVYICSYYKSQSNMDQRAKEWFEKSKQKIWDDTEREQFYRLLVDSVTKGKKYEYTDEHREY